MSIKNMRYGLVLFAVSFIFMFLGTSSASQAQCNLIPASNYFKIIGVTWGNATHIISAGPGINDVPLTVTLENYGGSCNFIDLKGYLELYGGISDFNGSSFATYYLNNLAPYSIFNMVFNLNIAKNVSAGNNTVLSYPFYISWNYTNDTIRSTQEYNLSIPLYGSPDLSFSVKNQPLIAGELNNVTLQVKNTGSGKASDLSPEISISGASILTQPSKISVIEPNTTKNVFFYAYLPSSSAGQPVTLNLDYNYITPYGYNTSIATTVDTYAVPNYNNGVSISILNNSIESGNIQNTSIVAYDTSSYPIKNLTITLTPSSPITLLDSDGIINFPTILPNSKVKMPISLYLTPSSSTVGSISAAVSYILNGQPESTTLLLNVLTPSNIELTNINTVILPSSPTVGSSFTLTSTLNNIGSETASAVSITPEPIKGISIEGENTTSLGSIPVDTPTAFTLSFLISQSFKPGIYNIPIMVSYLNNLNQQINQTIIFPVNISKSTATFITSSGAYVATSQASGNATAYRNFKGGGGVPIILIITIIIIIVILVYYFYKRRKNSKRTKAHQ